MGPKADEQFLARDDEKKERSCPSGVPPRSDLRRQQNCSTRLISGVDVPPVLELWNRTEDRNPPFARKPRSRFDILWDGHPGDRVHVRRGIGLVCRSTPSRAEQGCCPVSQSARGIVPHPKLG